jgi:hypothetical protein
LVYFRSYLAVFYSQKAEAGFSAGQEVEWDIKKGRKQLKIFWSATPTFGSHGINY